MTNDANASVVRERLGSLEAGTILLFNIIDPSE